ncbi:MAG: glycosyltransferase [Thaumarchaeota archaeon]|nr:glycosyltransferase [Nitrososphaerota archaeon]
MKLLIAGAKPKFFHLTEFADALTKLGVECKLVHDLDIYTGFPSRNIRNWFQTRKKFNNLVKEFKPDAVFIDRMGHFGIAALKANLPLFVHLRGDYWSEIKWAKETLYKGPLKRTVIYLKDRMARQCFKGATIILPICKYLENRVREHYPDKKSYVLYGGIESSRWFPVTGMELKHPCVGILQGAWIWGKAKEMLTLTKVLESMPNVTFYWAGDGPYRDKILSSLQKYENFKWLGSLEYPGKVREYLAGIDIYALVSGIDMSPLTLQEAQLMEKPVIATNAGGIPELMKDKETGFLVEKGDYNDWIDKISILIKDNNKAKQMGKDGRKFVIEYFSWEKIAREFLPILNKSIHNVYK